MTPEMPMITGGGGEVWCDRTVQRLYPSHRAGIGRDDLVAAYRYPDPGAGPWVRATMVATLDGAAWGPDHRSGSISSPADQHAFALMRGLADAILVGAGTARAEHYGPAVTSAWLAGHRAGLGQRPNPVVAVVSRRLDFDPAAPLFAAATERTVVFTTERSPAERRAALAGVADVVVAGEQDVDLGRAVRALAERGLPRIMCEGGPQLLADVAAVGALDELCLTVSPLLTGGDAPRILAGDPVPDEPWQLSYIFEDGGTLLTRWVRQPPPSTSARS
jgi:riboflavin-specific deaminase-like protein